LRGGAASSDTSGTTLVRLTDQVVAVSDAYAVFLPERRAEARLRVAIDALVEMFERDRAALSGTVPGV
jgi:hypothetical protein